ncbi:hypothetical protein [Planctomyces sp. SH-PL62]|uniref:hypothetical protein n=1 Tax=Planctomyces sp. SH-PL62 TaxID=1636152 RepID=UPI00078D1409|nr:hypothetical protein [Planctomyces sp. SH-PL62]AMV41063.1 Sigma-70, region 4 [Planctomyces sp. SH-PL62]
MAAMDREARIRLGGRIRRLYGQGAAVEEIAVRCGVTTAAVYAKLARSETARFELASLRRALWVERRREGMSVPQIARLSRVSEAAVRQGLKKAAALAADDLA